MRLRCNHCNAPRKGTVCHKCGRDLVPTLKEWRELRLPPVDKIRALAKEVGYALGVHGSLERDLDLIAAPWTEAAVSAQELAEHIARGIGGRIMDPNAKPLGRWACNIAMDGWFKLIDLSVAPRVEPDR